MLFEGVSLADVKSVSAWFEGTYMSTSGYRVPAAAWHYANDGSTLTVQFQGYLGGYTKGVILQLVQDGDDIKGCVTAMRYIADQFHFRDGEDMDNGNWRDAPYYIGNLSLHDTVDEQGVSTTLWWNGGDGGAWDGTTANWLAEDGTASAWIGGARAAFTNDAAISVAVDAGGIAASHITIGGFPVTFTGGTVEMRGPSEVALRGGTARFECPVSGVGTNGFRIANASQADSYSSSNAIPAQSTLLMRNATLAGVDSLYGLSIGSSSNAGNSQQSFFLENDGSTLTAQMQWYAGNYTKCVFIELTQQGKDIYGRVSGAAYFDDSGVSHLGEDVTTHPKYHSQDTFKSDGTAVYGIRSLLLGRRVELASACTFKGVVRLDNVETLAVTDGGTLGGGTYDGPITCNYWATLEISHTRQSLDGRMHDSGRLHVKGTVDPAGGTMTYSGKLPTDGSVIFQNANLSAWTAVNAQFAPDSMSNKNYPDGTTFYFRNSGDKVRCQFQVKDDSSRGYVKCAAYEFAQVGDDITCRKILGAYTTGWDTQFGKDFEDSNPNGANGYLCANLVVTYTNATDTSVTIGGKDSNYTFGTIVDGALLAVTNATSIPSSAGRVTTLKGGAKMFIDVRAVPPAAGALGHSTVEATEGSFLRFGRFRSNGAQAVVKASGGSEVSIAGGNGSGSMDYGYLTHLTLDGGSVVTGDTFRTGNENGANGTAGITVSNGPAARVAIPFYLLRYSGTTTNDHYGDPWTLDVSDVTGDASTDLFIDEAVGDYSDNYAGRPVLKTGGGTVRFGAANTFAGGVTIDDGAILFGTNGVFGAANPLTLAGGTLDAGTATNAVGALTLSASSAISLSDGVSLSFADSSAATWADGATLEISGGVARRALRFGTDANGLTAAQLGQVRWNGRRIALDADGYAHLKGLIISVH